MDELASYIVYNNPKKALYCVEISKGKACRKAKCIYPFSLAIQDAWRSYTLSRLYRKVKTFRSDLLTYLLPPLSTETTVCAVFTVKLGIQESQSMAINSWVILYASRRWMEQGIENQENLLLWISQSVKASAMAPNMFGIFIHPKWFIMNMRGGGFWLGITATCWQLGNVCLLMRTGRSGSRLGSNETLRPSRAEIRWYGGDRWGLGSCWCSWGRDLICGLWRVWEEMIQRAWGVYKNSKTKDWAPWSTISWVRSSWPNFALN